MVTYIYDGSFEGLLTAINRCFKSKEQVSEITTPERFQPDLFSEAVMIETAPEEARACYRRLEALSGEITSTITYAFLTEQPGVELLILNYLKTLFSEGVGAIANLNHPAIYQLYHLRCKVRHEIDRYHGFVRFQQLASGIYYSPIEPDYNVVQFLAPHFTARFADQRWMIHDIRRGTGIFYDLTHCVYLSWVDRNHPLLRPIFSESGGNALSADGAEFKYQLLWKRYFKVIAIQERHNPKVQRQRMPRRYWKYLIENVEP